MFEDVEQWLGNFRDSENIVKLLEVVCGKGLGMEFGVSDDKDDGMNEMTWSMLDNVIDNMCKNK